MNVRVFRTGEEAAHAAAAAVAAQLRRKPRSVLGLPTGRTSHRVYEQLIALHEAGNADFSQAHTFNIDEFVGLDSNDARSYGAFMRAHLFSRINLPVDQIHCLSGNAPDHLAECDRFDRDIASLGGLDLLVLGIGANAHIGFNEPGRTLRVRTHKTSLASVTRRSNAALFGGRLEEVPREALTMGVGTMFEARAIVLIATGRSKARAVSTMFGGEISAGQPASVLQLHANVEVLLDSAAAAMLPQPGFDAQS
jgi:glucosamine-6-phosphate deaminase